MSIEFYVIMFVIAASIVILSVRPRTRGEVKEYLLSSVLSTEDTGISTPEAPSIEFACLDNGHVLLYRRGLEGVSMTGAVSIAAKYDDVNLQLEERLVVGSQWDAAASEARFDIDFLPPGRYHVTYNSQKTGLFVAMQLHVRPGLVATRILSH